MTDFFSLSFFVICMNNVLFLVCIILSSSQTEEYGRVGVGAF